MEGGRHYRGHNNFSLEWFSKIETTQTRALSNMPGSVGFLTLPLGDVLAPFLSSYPATHFYNFKRRATQTEPGLASKHWSANKPLFNKTEALLDSYSKFVSVGSQLFPAPVDLEISFVMKCFVFFSMS